MVTKVETARFPASEEDTGLDVLTAATASFPTLRDVIQSRESVSAKKDGGVRGKAEKMPLKRTTKEKHEYGWDVGRC